MHQLLLERPPDMFDREAEWAALSSFLAPSSSAGLGLVYGRRRQGKSHLLNALAEASGGFYFEAAQAGTEQNLSRFATLWATASNQTVPPAFANWEQALGAVLAGSDGRPVVLDEFNYLIEADPSLPSAVQRLFGPRSPAQVSKSRLLLCGSVFSVMAELLAGTAPLRGRANLELVVRPFDYRTAAAFWGLDRDPETAFKLYALIGGTPAYRSMSRDRAPRSSRDLPTWAAEHLLHPASALFREGRVVVDEDPSVPDRMLSWSILAAVADGNKARTDIARAVGREATALSRPIDALLGAGLLERDNDVLRQRRGTYRITEPLIVTRHLVIAPNERRLSRGHARDVWNDSEHLITTRLMAPAFELVAREWLENNARELLGAQPTAVGPTVVSCPQCASGQTAHQLDVVALRREASGSVTIDSIGEAKWQSGRVGVDQALRLSHVRDRLGTPAAAARLTLFSRSGFTAELERLTRTRPDLVLVDLPELYR